MPMTAVPQRTAHLARVRRAGVGAGRHGGILPADHAASASHGRADRRNPARLPDLHGQPDGMRQVAGGAAQRPITYTRPESSSTWPLLRSPSVLGVVLILDPDRHRICSRSSWCSSLLFGVLLIIPIGGADMPTVIALLNSYAGLSACAMGFALDNKLLIIAGALDGSSGLDSLDHHVQGDEPLVHQRAVRRVRAVQAAAGKTEARRCAAPAPEEAAQILEAASSVIIIPGYGMAVAQAQHKIRELSDMLTQARCRRQVRHPSGGRPHARPHERAAGRSRYSV